MDLRQYFRKLREIEASLADEYPVVVSAETSDGGRQGVTSEVPREIAAKLILDGRAVLASEDQRLAFLAHLAARKQKAEQLDLARRVQVAIIADSDLQHSIVSRSQPERENGN